VFPSDGQASDQQSKDEGECYKWAVGNTGYDPFQAKKDAEYARQQAETQKQSSQQASRGAAAGAVHSRRSARRYQAQTAEQADQYAASEAACSADKIENFKKALSACLEAKKYTVKYQTCSCRYLPKCLRCRSLRLSRRMCIARESGVRLQDTGSSPALLCCAVLLSILTRYRFTYPDQGEALVPYLRGLNGSGS